jgi:hypothetical protein
MKTTRNPYLPTKESTSNFRVRSLGVFFTVIYLSLDLSLAIARLDVIESSVPVKTGSPRVVIR